MVRAFLISAYLLLSASASQASDFLRITPDRLEEQLQIEHTFIIADLQQEDDFQEKHFKGSVWIAPTPTGIRKKGHDSGRLPGR